MSEIATSGCTFKASISSTDGSLISYQVTPPSASDKILVNNAGIYSGEISVTVDSGASAVLASYPTPGFTVSPTVSPATVKIKGTASNVLEDDNKCIQKGDSGKGTLTFPVANNNTGATFTVDVEVTVEITDAGQTDVTAS